ncbi:TfuA-like protein [Xanthobacter sp. AM11]|uniref:TfuA-like protein n=1 Tax=Xanthobacter sp. AM11 TaxID=3380643 RepID=UPI0039BEE718
MSARAPDIAVFVGPTGSGVDEIEIAMRDPRILRKPPIARGDLMSLPETASTVLIVDGYFGEVPSVGHLELLDTLRRKRIFGCSSMGAIRAFELRNDGMIGLGRVYEKFASETDFMDDEVALLHAPEPYFWKLSIPLVNVRFALAALQDAGKCDDDFARSIINELKRKYFGERTLDAVLGLAELSGGPSSSTALEAALRQSDVKCSDFADALRHVLALAPHNNQEVAV